MKEFSKYVGMDVHKATIAVSVAEADSLGALQHAGWLIRDPFEFSGNYGAVV